MTSNVFDKNEDASTATDGPVGLVAAGGILGALVASSCCILPLALFSLGVGGAWIGTLTAMAPYQPVFVVVTSAILGCGHYLVYRKPRTACDGGAVCARPLSDRFVKVSLWCATVLLVAATAFPFVAPYLLQIT